MRTLPRLLAAAMVAVLVAGCGTTTTPAAGAAATVDGSEIPRDRLETAVREVTGDVESLSPEERESQVGAQQRQILTFLIQDRVLESAASDLGIEITDADVEDTRARLLEQIGGEEQLDLALQQVGLTRELFEDVIVPQEARLAAIREQLLGDGVETRTARHILVDTQEEADEVVAELADGAAFEDLAEERSNDPGSGARGGDLGPSPRGAYVPEFDEAVWTSELNEVIGPVETQFGFHVIEVTDEGTLGTDDLSPQQVDQLVGQELNQLVGDAFDDADITIGAGLGEWDPEQRQVVPTGQVGQGGPAPTPLPGELEIEEPTDQ